MWSDNSSDYGFDSDWSRICHTPYCHTAAMACLCGCQASMYGSNPMNQWYNNVVPNSTNLQTYQGSPQNQISGFSHVNDAVNPLFRVENDRESREQMATKYSEEIDSWLLLNPDNQEDQNSLSSHQIDGCLNLRSYGPWPGNQCQGQFNQLQTQGVQQVNHNRNYGMIPSQSSREGLAEKQEEEIFKFYQGLQGDFSRAAFDISPSESAHKSRQLFENGIFLDSNSLFLGL